MATKRPSFLKRQKEQKRLSRAQAKRDARRDRKRLKDEMGQVPDEAGTDVPSDVIGADEVSEGTNGLAEEPPESPESPDADRPVS